VTDESRQQSDPADQPAPAAGDPHESEDAMESGAIIRSPRDESASELSNPATADPTTGESPIITGNDVGRSWPWEPESDATPPVSKVEAGPTVQTTSLYRSAGYEAETSAADPFDRGQTGHQPEAQATSFGDPIVAPTDQTAMLGDMSSATAVHYDPAPVVPEKGWNTGAVVLFLIVVTTVVGFIDMTMNQELTWITGGVFVLASVIAAFSVRPRDLWTAVISPPLAFLVALLISGQPSTMSNSGSLMLREASLIVTGLAFNAPYIFGGTALAFIIVLIRRTRIRK